MFRERIQEVFDFVQAESPYRSANKGWLTNDIFLQWKASEEDNSTGFDEVAKVSLYWKPIVQTALLIFTVISLATFLAFSPLAFSRGKLKSVSSIFSTSPTSLQSQESSFAGSSELESTVENFDEKDSSELKNNNFEKLNASNSSSTKLVINNFVATKKKMITATDLFQPKLK